MCDKCPEGPGLCSKPCFKEWHSGFEILLAARPLQSESAPSSPEQDQVQEALPDELQLQDPLEVPEERPNELLSAAEWARRQESRHYLIIKPPTRKSLNPKLKCKECTRRGARKERRTICNGCTPHVGFCSMECLRAHHFRENIFVPQEELQARTPTSERESPARTPPPPVQEPSARTPSHRQELAARTPPSPRQEVADRALTPVQEPPSPRQELADIDPTPEESPVLPEDLF